MSYGKDFTLNAQQVHLKELLSQCTEPQQALFSRMYPGGISSLEGWRLENAMDQCYRTITKNRKLSEEAQASETGE